MMTENILLETGREVARQEAKALAALADSLGADFLAAIKMILEPGRRVAVCGMGKSGHVGRKIAATLASTGTPSYFIHPAEACHGDLGMLGPRDILLAISNSGATRELGSIVQFCQRHGLPIISMTHNLDSPLAKASAVALHLVYAAEACPLGCAPTTSTTVALALGDALAMALLKARGFSEADFNEFHPGGALGMRLLLVRDIMRSGGDLPLVREEADFSSILLEMTLKGLGCAGVVNASGQLTGIITDGDVRRHVQNNPGPANAANLMTRNPQAIELDATVAKAIKQMNDNGITALMVVENSRPAGIVHMHDCLRQRW